MTSNKRRALLVLGGVAGLIVIAVLSYVVPANVWASIGGITTAIGGLAAAAAAFYSWQAAKNSDESVARMNQISEESRTALGRAMKPAIKCMIMEQQRGPYLQLSSDGRWPARDIEALVEIPGREVFHSADFRDLGTGGLGNFASVDIPGPPDDIKKWLTPGTRELRCGVVVAFADRDGLLRYENHYEVDVHTSAQPFEGRYVIVEPMVPGKLIKQHDWPADKAPPITLFR